MEQLIELLEQIQDLAGVAVDAIREAGGEKPEGEKGEGPPKEGGPPKPEGEGGEPPKPEGSAAREGAEPEEEEGGKKPPFGRRY